MWISTGSKSLRIFDEKSNAKTFDIHHIASFDCSSRFFQKNRQKLFASTKIDWWQGNFWITIPFKLPLRKISISFVFHLQIVCWHFENADDLDLLDTMKSIKRNCQGVRFSDILLSALSISFQTYFTSKGYQIPNDMTVVLPARIEAEGNLKTTHLKIITKKKIIICSLYVCRKVLNWNYKIDSPSDCKRFRSLANHMQTKWKIFMQKCWKFKNIRIFYAVHPIIM